MASMWAVERFDPCAGLHLRHLRRALHPRPHDERGPAGPPPPPGVRRRRRAGPTVRREGGPGRRPGRPGRRPGRRVGPGRGRPPRPQGHRRHGALAGPRRPGPLLAAIGRKIGRTRARVSQIVRDVRCSSSGTSCRASTAPAARAENRGPFTLAPGAGDCLLPAAFLAAALRRATAWRRRRSRYPTCTGAGRLAVPARTLRSMVLRGCLPGHRTGGGLAAGPGEGTVDRPQAGGGPPRRPRILRWRRVTAPGPPWKPRTLKRLAARLEALGVPSRPAGRHSLHVPGWHPTRLNRLLAGRHWGPAHALKKADAEVVGLYARLQRIPPASGRRRVSLVITLARGSAPPTPTPTGSPPLTPWSPPGCC